MVGTSNFYRFLSHGHWKLVSPTPQTRRVPPGLRTPHDERWRLIPDDFWVSLPRKSVVKWWSFIWWFSQPLWYTVNIWIIYGYIYISRILNNMVYQWYFWLVVELPSPLKKWWSSSLGMTFPIFMEKSSIHVPNHQPKRNWQEYRKNKGNLQICFSIINQLHGAGIFTYMNDWVILCKCWCAYSSTMEQLGKIFWNDFLAGIDSCHAWFWGDSLHALKNYSAGCEGQFSHQTWYQTQSNTVFKHSHHVNHMAMGQNSRPAKTTDLSLSLALTIQLIQLLGYPITWPIPICHHPVIATGSLLISKHHIFWGRKAPKSGSRWLGPGHKLPLWKGEVSLWDPNCCEVYRVIWSWKKLGRWEYISTNI